MSDLIYDVVSYCAWNCNVGKISVNDYIFIENPKKETLNIRGSKNCTRMSI